MRTTARPKHLPRRRARDGFTLIELLVVMTVLGIMMTIAVPSFRSFVGNQRVKSSAYELMSSVLIARSEAIKRNGAVTVAAVSSTAWENGWSVTGGGATLHQQQAMDGVSVTSYTDNTCASAGTVASVVFSNSGRPAASSCFKFSTTATSTTRCVKVDLSGIPSSGTCP